MMGKNIHFDPSEDDLDDPEQKRIGKLDAKEKAKDKESPSAKKHRGAKKRHESGNRIREND